MAEKESFDIDGLMVFEGDYTARDQDGNVVAGVITPDRYKRKDREPLSSEQTGRYTNTTAYWKDHSEIVPANGDVYIYSDAATTEQGGVTVYVPKLKVGDGVTSIDNLPFTDSDTQQGTAGTLDTTNTTAQTPSASEPLSGNVNLHKVAKTGDYDDLNNKPSIPTVNDAVLTIQKNGTTIDTFTANAATDKTINITVPTTAADVSALPSSTKYGASLSLSVNSSTFVVTAQLKDQDGNNLGNAQTIDLPLESVVVSGSYNAQTKKVVLTLQNGSTIEFSVADLVAGLQSEITAQNPLSADLVVDGTTNKVFTLTMKTKLDGIEAGAEVNVQSDWNQTDNTADDFIQNKPTIPAAQVNSDWNASSGVAEILHKPTLGTAAAKDVPSSGDAATTEVVMGDDTRLTNARTPTSHTHGNITNDGKVGSASGKILTTGTDGAVQASDSITTLQISDFPTLAAVATSGSYNDLSNKPTIPSAQVNADWNASSGVAEILNKPVSGKNIDIKPVVPSEYTFLNWAGNNANTYINTGFVPDVDDIEIELIVRPVGDVSYRTSFYMFQSRTSSDGSNGITGSSSTNSIFFEYCGSRIESSIRRDAAKGFYTIRCKAKNGNMSMYVKVESTGAEDTVTGTYTYSQRTLPFYLWGNQVPLYNAQDNRVKSLKVRKAGTLVIDYYSVKRNSDNAIGFFDTRTQTFIAPTAGSAYNNSTDTVSTPMAINTVDELPSLNGNSGKVLAVNSGATGVEWVRPVTIYSGSSAPSAATGIDGDIYIQEVV